MPANEILVLTKPFIDSDRTNLRACTIIGTDALHMFVSRDGRGRFAVPFDTILDIAEAD